MHVYGRVQVTFDACGFEFSSPFWVVDLHVPVDMMLGMDWLKQYNPKVDWRKEGNEMITDADAKRVRKLSDTYVTE